MAYLYSYFSSYLWNTEKETVKTEDTNKSNKFLISIDDLNKVNLNIITSEIETLINDSDLLIIFKTKLLEIGYFQHNFYNDKNFQIVEGYKFRVDDNFPKLLRSNIPREIVNASYEINVEKITKEIF